MAITFVMRIWMPDRPGALGAVASRVGAVGGDVVGIDILERGAGRAIDELVVELPDEGLVDLLIEEVRQVDGVDVEDIKPSTGEMWGNFPQAYSHVGLIHAAFAAAPRWGEYGS